MRVLHLIGSKEAEASKSHLLPLLKKLKNEEDIMLCVFEWGDFAEEAAQDGTHIICLEKRFRYDVTVLMKLRRVIKDVDILHTHGPRANLCGLFLSKTSKFQWVTTVHSDPLIDLMDSGVGGRVLTRLNVRSLKNADHCFTISRNFTIKLAFLGLNQKRLTTIINDSSFEQPPQLKEEQATKVDRLCDLVLKDYRKIYEERPAVDKTSRSGLYKTMK